MTALLTVAIAAAIGSVTIAYNSGAADDADHGSATYLLRFDGTDPRTLEASLNSARKWFGTSEVIGHRSPRPPGGDRGAEDCDEDDHREQCPRQAERVDAMVERGLEHREDREPEPETHDCPDHCANRADDGAVPQQHESKVLLRRTDRGEHAELAEPPLSNHREAGGGDERGQEQEDGAHGEHRQGAGRLVLRPRLGPGECGRGVRSAIEGLAEGVDRAFAGVNQNRDVVGRPRGRGRYQRELVTQLARVLDDADDRPPTAVERHG